jgi:hypothetical protein
VSSYGKRCGACEVGEVGEDWRSNAPIVLQEPRAAAIADRALRERHVTRRSLGRGVCCQRSWARDEFSCGWWLRQERPGHQQTVIANDVVTADQPDDTDLLGCPEILPPTSEGVLAPGKHLVEVLDELWISTEAVVDHSVMVIAHGTRQQHFDLGSQRGLDEAVRESVVRLGIGPQEELALGAAPGDQVEAIRVHLPRYRHHRRSNKNPANNR